MMSQYFAVLLVVAICMVNGGFAGVIDISEERPLGKKATLLAAEGIEFLTKLSLVQNKVKSDQIIATINEGVLKNLEGRVVAPVVPVSRVKRHYNPIYNSGAYRYDYNTPVVVKEVIIKRI